MTTRTAEFNYRTSGVRESGAEVISFADALDRAKRRGDELSGALPRTQAQVSSLGGAAHAAADDFARFASTGLGPVGVGLAGLVNMAPRAAASLLGVASGAGQATAMSRLLNTTILSGTAVVLGATTVAVAYTKHLIEQADAYAELHARVRIYTTGAGEALEVEQKLYDQARQSRQGAEPTVKLFSRLMPEMQDFGKTPADAVNIAGLIQKSMTIQGASGQESRYGIIDLIHALGTGQLGGRQLRGLQTEAPVLLRYISDNLKNDKGGFGVPYGQLAEMAKAKQLGADKVFAALERAAPQIEKDFVNAPKTAAQGWQILNDQITRAVGQIAAATGLQKGIFDWLDGLTSKAEAFRQKLLADPKAIQGVKEFGEFIGGAVSSIGSLGAVAVKHFDDIVMAGQAVIALKLGEVMAGWFAKAAQAALGARANLAATFKGLAIESGAMNSAPEDVKAAAALRVAAARQVQIATQLEEVATQKATAATSSKAIADVAARTASEERARAGATEAEVTAAQTVADKTAEAATKAKTLADTAAARAATQKGVATAATAAAEEAETAIIIEATIATDAWTLAKRTGAAAVNLLGGAIGIATIAIGALIFAIWRENEAYKAELQAVRDSMDVKIQLAKIEGQLAGALDQSSAALERNRQAAINAARANIANTEARIAGMKADLADAKHAAQVATAGEGSEGFAFGSAPAESHAEHIISDLQGVVAGAKAKLDADARTTEIPVQQAVARETRDLRDHTQGDSPELAARRAAASLEISAAQARMKAASAETEAARTAMDAAVKTGKGGPAIARYQSATAKENQARQELDVAGEKLAAATPREAQAHSTAAKKGKGRTAEENALDKIVEQADYGAAYMRGAPDKVGFKDGQAIDKATGDLYAARGPDEVRAIQEYLAAMDKVKDATVAELAARHTTRAELQASLTAVVNYKLANSEAAKADEAWAQMTLKLSGITGELHHNEQEVNKVLAERKAKGLGAPQDAARVLALGQLKDRLEAVKAAETRARTAYDTASRQVDEKRITPSEKTGVTTAEAIRYAHAIEDEKVALARRSLIKEHDAQIASDVLTAEQRKDIDAKLQDDLAALELVKVERRVQAEAAIRRKANEGYERDIDRMTGQMAGAFHDLVFSGDFGNFGKQVTRDILEQMYKELIGNPLTALIHSAINALFHPDQFGGASFGGGGGLNGFFSSVMSFFGGGGGAAASSAGSGFASGIGAAMGFSDGVVDLRAGSYRPGADDVDAKLTRGESVVTREGTRKNRGLLYEINRGRQFQVVPGFADGVVGLGSRLTAAVLPSLPGYSRGGGTVLHFHAGQTVFNAPGADPQQLKALQRQQMDYQREEPVRFRRYYDAMQGRPS